MEGHDDRAEEVWPEANGPGPRGPPPPPGGAGAIVPNLAFRLGYAGAVLLPVQRSSDYWFRHDRGPLLLLGLACWAVVAVGVRAIRWWVRPDPRVEGTSEPPGFWDGSGWGDQPGDGPAR
jgi:hypothetical protein